MTDELSTSQLDDTPKKTGNTINCPDCEMEHKRPQPGAYKCTQCFCKFTVEPDQSIKIIPFFDEMKFEPIMVMLAVLGLVLLVAMGDKYMSFTERLNFYLLFVAVVYGVYKISQILCRRYRGVDRFFRKISRPRFIKAGETLIDLNNHPDQ